MTVTAPPRDSFGLYLVPLRRIPFFGGLPDELLALIAARLRREHYVKDDVVFVQGGLGNAMYLIESGQVVVVLQSGAEEQILSTLGPGSCVGEMALLLGELRAATVRVAVDADLLVLQKSDLDDLLMQHPSIALTFSRELSRRLSFTVPSPVRAKTSRIVAVCGGSVDALAESLFRQTGSRALIMKLEGAALAPGVSGAAGAAFDMLETPPHMRGTGLAELLNVKQDQYGRVLLYIPPRASELTLKAMELADVSVQIGPATPQWKQVLEPHRPWFTPGAPADIDALARRIARKSVGLALSAGSARGIAHIGVLKVLADNQIPIDLMAGAGAGALFGGMYAAGMTIDELTGFALQLHKKSRLSGGLWDFAIPPRSGFIKGHKTASFLRKFLGDKRLEELRLPMHIVATDVLLGEEVVFSEGSLVDAIRASMSVAGVFAPAKIGARHFVDGGAVNPVPTSVLAERGADLIIASSVIPSLEDRLQGKALQRPGRLPNLVGVLLGVMEVMQSEIIRSGMRPAHVVIRPPVENIGLQEFERAPELIQMGADAASRALDQIRQLFVPLPRERAH